MNKRGTIRVLGASVAAVSLLSLAGTAQADLKCRSTVAKESAKLTQAIAKILQKCEQSDYAKQTGACPDAKSTTCRFGGKRQTNNSRPDNGDIDAACVQKRLVSSARVGMLAGCDGDAATLPYVSEGARIEVVDFKPLQIELGNICIG
jgi:hypothetical protein